MAESAPPVESSTGTGDQASPPTINRAERTGWNARASVRIMAPPQADRPCGHQAAAQAPAPAQPYPEVLSAATAARVAAIAP